MKVWKVQIESEGAPTYVKLFAEDTPPSIEDIRQFLIDNNSTYRLDDMLKSISEGKGFHGSYQSLEIGLVEVFNGGK